MLFVIWSTTAFVLEVPSGAWADTYSRRKLLVLGALISALGYAAWITVPSFAGFALGFVLWGMSSALISGTFEAFVYDELAARDCTDKYAGFALGFALWGTSSALISGTFEAFVYDELAARDRTARYPTRTTWNPASSAR